MFLHLIKTKLDLNIEDNAIDRCHLVGCVSTHNKCPVLVKFTSYEHKQLEIKDRRQLKRTGIVVKEDLITANFCLLDHARKHRKVKNCWTLEGHVFEIIEGTNKAEVKIKINSSTDLANL